MGQGAQEGGQRRANLLGQRRANLLCFSKFLPNFFFIATELCSTRQRCSTPLLFLNKVCSIRSSIRTAYYDQQQICALLDPTGSKVKKSITCCIPDSVNRLVPPPAPTMRHKENVYQVHPLHKGWHLTKQFFRIVSDGTQTSYFILYHF